jgi:dihydrofolate reductase
MRELIVSNLQSLDGFMAGPKGEIDWFTGLADKEFEAYGIELIGSVDTILFGRVTYQLMAGYWPTASASEDDPRIIEAMNNLPKIVFSRTLDRVEWKNSRLVKTDPAEEVARLKQQAGKYLVIYGSGGLVSELSRRGLIDEYRIFVAPLVLGGGVPMFRGLEKRLPLRLSEVRSFRSGTVLLRYEPK